MVASTDNNRLVQHFIRSKSLEPIPLENHLIFRNVNPTIHICHKNVNHDLHIKKGKVSNAGLLPPTPPNPPNPPKLNRHLRQHRKGHQGHRRSNKAPSKPQLPATQSQSTLTKGQSSGIIMSKFGEFKLWKIKVLFIYLQIRLFRNM